MLKFNPEEIIFLANKLQEFLSTKLDSPVEINQRNYCYVLDQSGSVTAENYRKMLSCVKLLLEMNEQSKSNNFSLYSFNTTVYQESSLNNDPTLILKKIKDVEYRGGGTDTPKVLKDVYSYLSSNSNKQTLNYIILFTDGDINGSNQIIKTINQNPNFKLCLIFINFKLPNNFYDQFQEVFQHQVIELKNFELMVEVFDYLKEKNNEIPQLNDCIPACNDVEMWAEFSNMEQIRNFVYQIFLKSGEMPEQPDIIARFENRKIDKLKEDTEYKIRVAVEYKSGYLSKWSPFKFFKTFSLNRMASLFKQEPTYVRAYIEDMKVKLPSSEPSKILKQMGFRNFNVVFLGPMGNGKSSLINTMISVFNNKYVEAENVNASKMTVTKNFTQVKMFSQGRGGLSFYDIFGYRFDKLEGDAVNVPKTFENSNYGFQGCLWKILNGTMAVNYLEWDDPDNKRMYNPNHKSVNTMMHAIGLVISIDSMTDEKSREINKNLIKEIIEKFGYNPLLIITKCDQYIQKKDPDWNISKQIKIKTIWEDPEIITITEKFLQYVNIPKENMVLMSNILSQFTEEQRDLTKEALALDTLDILKSKAENFVKARLRDAIIVRSQKNEFLGWFMASDCADMIFRFEPQIREFLANHNKNEDYFYMIPEGDQTFYAKKTTANSLIMSKLIDPDSPEYKTIKLWLADEEEFSGNSKLMLKSFAKTGERIRKISMCMTLAEIRKNNLKECRGYCFYMPSGEKVAENKEENTRVEDAVEFVQRETNSKFDFYYQIVQKLETGADTVIGKPQIPSITDQNLENLMLTLEHAEKQGKESFNLGDLSISVLREALKKKKSQFCNENFNTKEEQSIDKALEEKITINQCVTIKGNQSILVMGTKKKESQGIANGFHEKTDILLTNHKTKQVDKLMLSDFGDLREKTLLEAVRNILTELEAINGEFMFCGVDGSNVPNFVEKRRTLENVLIKTEDNQFSLYYNLKI